MSTSSGNSDKLVATEVGIEALHRKLAPSQQAFDLVWTHCRIVANLAVGFAQRYAANPPEPERTPWGSALPNVHLTYIGGLIHDIGVYRVFDEGGVNFAKGRYIFHGLEGYKILLDNGYGEALAQFARNHTGVGITKQDVEKQNLPLPPADYTPRTIEQEVVMYADKFHTKSHPPTFVSPAAARSSAARFGQANASRFDALEKLYGSPALATLAKKYGMSIR